MILSEYEVEVNIRKDYEIAKYQEITRPLIDLSDVCVTLDTFNLPTKRNIFLQMLSENQLEAISHRFQNLIQKVPAILSLISEKYPDLKVLHISVGGSYCYARHNPTDIDFNVIVEGDFFSYYDVFKENLNESLQETSVKKISFMIFGLDNLMGKGKVDDSVLSRSFLHTNMTIREGIVMMRRNITIYGRDFLDTVPPNPFNYLTRILRQLFQAELLLKNEVGLEYPEDQRFLKAFSRVREAGILFSDSFEERKKWFNISVDEIDLSQMLSNLTQKVKEKLKMKNLQIISPSKSAFYLSEEKKQASLALLKKYFDTITFSKYFAEEPSHGISAPVAHRVEEFHEAFKNPGVDVIMAYSGGFDCNQLLDFIDWDCVKNNPKIFCGMSDITVLCNAIYAKTGVVTFLGPVFSQFATFEKDTSDFSVDCLNQMLISHKMVLPISKKWSNDRWTTQEEKTSEDFASLNVKNFEGTLIGGNLSSFDLLFQTPYMLNPDKIVLLLEEDDHICSMPNGMGPDFFFERELTHITQMDFFDKVQAILIGRFRKESHITATKIKEMVQNNSKLKDLPIIYGLDFGHTNPVLTLPIGGVCRYGMETGALEVSF